MIYTFEDKGKRKVGLKYDLTVPVSRVFGNVSKQYYFALQTLSKSNLCLGQKKPQKGRYREVLQCDVDIFGVKTPLADAEVVAVTYKLLSSLGFTDFIIKINSRQVLFTLLSKFDLSKEKQNSILQSLDKLERREKKL